MKHLKKIRGIKAAGLVAAALLVLLSAVLVSRRGAPEARRYEFSLLYMILYDDDHGPLPPEAIYERRLARLATVIERESFGRIGISPRLRLIHAEELGDDHLTYSARGIEDWISLLEEFCTQNGIAYDILLFLPASQKYGPWCTDAPSLGFSYDNRKYLCLETFLDQTKEAEDAQAVALAIHKLFHGFGYNHISQENRPSNLLEWSIGLPKTRILPLAPREKGARIIFDRHIMKVLGFLPRNEFEEELKIGKILHSALRTSPDRKMDALLQVMETSERLKKNFMNLFLASEPKKQLKNFLKKERIGHIFGRKNVDKALSLCS